MVCGPLAGRARAADMDHGIGKSIGSALACFASVATFDPVRLRKKAAAQARSAVAA